MTLLEINESEVELRNLVFKETEKIFGVGGGTVIWLNGKRSNEGLWIFNPSKKEIKFSRKAKNIEEIPDYSVDHDEDYYDNSTELCLSLQSFDKSYQIDSYACTHKSYFYCELFYL